MLYVDVQGESVPALGFGTWQLRGEQCRQAVRHALEIGYRHIDTAQNYMNEGEVGRAIAESGVPREDVFVTTKLARNQMSGEQVGPATDRSLRELGVDRIDLYLIHWPSEQVPLAETLDAMIAQKDAGKVRHLGVSNFRAPLLKQALEHTPILADQVPYQPGRTQRSLCEVCTAADVMLTAYSPLRGQAIGSPAIAGIAAARGRSPQQVALRWLLQQPNVAPIPRSSSSEHRRQNFDVFDFELSSEEMDGIFALAQS